MIEIKDENPGMVSGESERGMHVTGVDEDSGCEKAIDPGQLSSEPPSRSYSRSSPRRLGDIWLWSSGTRQEFRSPSTFVKRNSSRVSSGDAILRKPRLPLPPEPSFLSGQTPNMVLLAATLL